MKWVVVHPPGERWIENDGAESDEDAAETA
jgi:hypothetical protein